VVDDHLACVPAVEGDGVQFLSNLGSVKQQVEGIVDVLVDVLCLRNSASGIYDLVHIKD
jgi:hypothetical protein